MFPPHLPPQSCNIENHKRWHRIKILCIVVVFGVLAGMSGASMMLGWIWPRYGEGEAWFASYIRPAISKTQLEEKVREEVMLRKLNVYDGLAVSGGVNTLKQKIGEAIVVGSDGWLAMYLPDYSGAFKNFNVLASSGKVFVPSKALFDKNSGVLYLKIDGGQFKVVSFDTEAVPQDDIFVYENQWKRGSIVGSIQKANSIPHLDSAPVTSYITDISFLPGSVVVNNQGRVVGFVKKDNVILPSYYVTQILPSVLSQKIITYPTLGVEGWFSQEQPIIIDSEEVVGFAVTKVLGANSIFKKGDIIQEIDGRVVTHENLWYIISNNQTAQAKVLRSGKLIEIQAKISEEKIGN